MSYTTPITAVPGEKHTAANWNVGVRDNFAFLSNPPNCRARRSISGVAVPTSTWTSIPWNQSERDTDNMHSITTNPERITATTAGVYAISFDVQFSANATGKRQARVHINAASYLELGDSSASASGSIAQHLNSYTEIRLAAGDYVKLELWQDSGADLNMSPLSSMCARWVAV